MVGCEIIYSANPPDYKIEIPDFTRLFGSIKNFNEIKNNISDISILYKVTKTCEELKNKYRVFDRYKEMLDASKNNTTHRSYADIISYSDQDIRDFYEQTIMKCGDGLPSHNPPAPARPNFMNRIGPMLKEFEVQEDEEF